MADVCISLTASQALVLFEWLARADDAEDGAPAAFDHPSERQVLADIGSMLESKLTAPLESDYERRLDHAREEVGGSG